MQRKKIDRTHLNALKAEMIGKGNSKLTRSKPSKMRGDLSMHPSVRKMKIAFFGRNKAVPYVLESMKVSDRKITFMSTWDKALAEVRNKEGKLIGIIKADREANKLSSVGKIPVPLMKEFKSFDLEKRGDYKSNELKQDKIWFMRNINFSLGKRFTKEQIDAFFKHQ